MTRRRPTQLLAFALAFTAGRASFAILHHPAGELAAAVNHLQSVPIERQANVRYLTLFAIPPAKRDQAIRCVNLALNATSRVRTIRHVTRVTPTLLAFELEQFTSSDAELREWHTAWETLALADPYFHLTTTILDPHTKQIRRIVADGGWLEPDLTTELRQRTQSTGALLRADYFIVRALSTLEGGVYYELAGVPATESEWFQSIGLDLKTVLRVRALGGANVNVSGVTGKPRRIFRLQGALGGSWHTLDSAEVLAERSPLHHPIAADGTFRLEYDAGEYIAVAPNGMLRFALYGADGKHQAQVPDNIAKDNSDPAGDGVLQPAISCVRCHVESGFRPFRDDLAALTSGRVDLLSTDESLIERINEFYDAGRLERQLTFDRETYDDAVQRATGLSAAQAAVELADTYRSFEYEMVSIPIAAREAGATEETFRQAIAATRDPTLLLLLSESAVLRKQWEASFAEAALSTAALRNEQTPAENDVSKTSIESE